MTGHSASLLFGKEFYASPLQRTGCSQLPSGTENRKRNGTVTRAFVASLKVRDVPECCPLRLLVVEATVQLRTGLVDEMFKGPLPLNSLLSGLGLPVVPKTE